MKEKLIKSIEDKITELENKRYLSESTRAQNDIAISNLYRALVEAHKIS